MRIDLHTHSTYSDGVLSPAALVARAADRKVDMLALTDHDETAGLAEAAAAARDAGIRFVTGVEVSVTWANRSVHVLGLGIGADAPELMAGLAGLRHSRYQRAIQIAAQLDAAGVSDSLSGALRFARNPAAIGRCHFARMLIEQGRARNMDGVFKRYFNPGKPGHLEHQWTSLRQAINWIHAAGGCAVLAHPDRYHLSRLMLNALFTEFKQRGGDAVEINAGPNSIAQIRAAREFGFALSTGSDFHASGAAFDLGDVAGIPAGSPVVWQRWMESRIAA